MAHYDNNRGAWVDSSGNTHSSEASARKASSNFQTEVAGAGGGCIAYLIMGSGAVVALVAAFAYIWPFAVVLLAAFMLLWIVAELYDRGKLKSKTKPYIVIAAIVVASFPFILHNRVNANFVPPITEVATVSSDGAGKLALWQKKGFFSSKLVLKDSATFVPNEKVKLIRSKVGGSYVEVEKIDGTKGFVYSKKHLIVKNQEKIVSIFKENDITLLTPPKFWSRVWKMDFRPARPGILQTGTYFPEGGNVEGIVRIEVRKLPVKYFNKKQWELGYTTFYTDKYDLIRCSKLVIKNNPPVELNRVPYNFSLSMATEDGKTFGFVVTSTSTLVSTDGKVTYRLKNEKN